MSFALGDFFNRKICGPNEVQISEVLALCNTISYADGDGVFTCLERKYDTGHVRTDKEVVVTNFVCFVSGCPTIGVVDCIFVLSAFVSDELSAANLLVLNSVVSCYVVQTSLLYGDSESDRVGSGCVIAVYVRIRKRTGTCADFIVCHVVTGGAVECIQPDYIFAGELFGKSCGEVEYIYVAVTVVVEGGRNFDCFEFVVTVFAYAFYDGVLVVVIYITTNGADTPFLIETVAVVVSFALGNLLLFFKSSGEGDGACGSVPLVCRIIGVNHDLDFVACNYSDNSRVNNGIAVGPLGIAVYVRGEVVDGVNPVCITHGDGKGAVSSCGPGVEIAIGACCNSCLVLTKNEVCRIFHSACGVGEIDNIILCLCGIVNKSDYNRRSKEAGCFVVRSFTAVDANEHAAESACDVKSAVCSNVYSYRSFGVFCVPYEFGVERILFAFAGNGLGICAGLSGGLGSGLRSGLRGGLACGLRGGLRGGIRYGICSLSGSLRSGRFLFLTKVTGSNGEHHNHDNNQGQDAQNVLFSHTRKPPFKIWSSAPWQHYIIIGKFLCDFS